MTETLTIEQLVLDELRAAFTRVAEHIGNDSSLDPNSVLGAPFALFMAERAVCKAFRQFADVEKESTTTREILTRLAALEAELATLHSRLEFTSCQKADVEAQVLELEEQNAALRQDAAILSALCGDDSLVLEAAVPTKRQQVAEAFLHAAETFSLDTEGRYEHLAEIIDAQTRKPNTLPRERAMFTAMAAVLEEAARDA